MARIFLLLLLFSSLFAQDFSHIKKESNKIGHLYIGGHKTQINQGTWIYVKNALDYYREEAPDFIILELDSPGGEVFSAQKISDALKAIDIQDDIPVVAVINNWAISAGAMLAYSSRYITTVKDGSMGAAAPITAQGQKTSEKVNSAIRSDFAGRAAFFDRNPLLAEAMVDASTLLVFRNGEVVELHNEEEIQPGDKVITKKDKLLTLTADEMVEYGVANALLLPAKLTPITEEEREKGRWQASKELLMTNPFFKQFETAEVISYKMSAKTRFFTFLSNPAVISMLFLAVMFCFYIELNTPGFGVAGSMGLFALFLILLASFAVQAASMLELVILVAGVGLILLELFVIPGFGITGILGIIMVVGALVALVLPSVKEITFDFDTNSLNAAGLFFLKRLAWLSGTLIVGVILIALSGRFITRKLALFSPLVLKGEQEKKKGFVSGPNASVMPKVGAKGIVVSPLRPAGKVEIKGELFDAVSSGDFLEKGKEVIVVFVEGSKIVVEAI